MEDFYSDKSKKDGRYTLCKECKGLRYTSSRKIMLQYYYLFGGCVACGYNRCFDCIDFHHIHSEDKDKAISKMATYKEERIRKELLKTVPLCKNCHGEYHTGVGKNKDFFIQIHERITGPWNL